MHRKPIHNKKKAASTFNHQNERTKLVNLSPPPMRGGYRM